MRKLLIILILTLSAGVLYGQKYRITFEAMLKTNQHHMECSSDFWIKIKNSSGVETYKVQRVIDREYGTGEEFKRTLYKDWNMATDGDIKTISIYAWHKDDPDGWPGCHTRSQGEAHITYTSADFPCSEKKVTGQIIGKHDGGSYLKVKIELIEPIYLQYVSQGLPVSTNILPDTEKIKIKVSNTNLGNIKNAYSWKYRIGYFGAPESIPNQFYPAKDELEICGADLFGGSRAAFLENVVKYNRQVQVWLDYGCGQSQTIILNGMKTAPYVISYDTIPNQCAKGNNAKIILTFNEPLLENESLSLGLNQLDERYKNITSFESGNKVTFDGLKAGSYNLVMIGKYPFDPNNPDDNTHTTYTETPQHSPTITLKDPPLLSFTATAKGAVKCFGGNDGSIEVSISGGSPPYKVLCNGSTLISDAGSSYTITGLVAGNHLIEVRDKHGCIPQKVNGDEHKTNITVAITQPAQKLTLSIVAPQPASEFGASDGEFQLSTSGGNGGYTYQWWKDGQDLGVLSATHVTGLSAGKYTVVVKDQNYGATTSNAGCTATDTVTITEPALLESSIGGRMPSCAGASNGSLWPHIEGGNPPYKNYKWYKKESGVWQPIQAAADHSLSGLSAGEYKFTAEDAKGKPTGISYTLRDPEPLEIEYIKTSQPSCYGSNDGWAEVKVKGGTFLYVYTWKKDFQTMPGKTTARITGLTEGVYEVTIRNSTDAGGLCRVESEMIIIGQPDSLNVGYQISLPSAHNASDGQIDLTVTGGTPPYSYIWNHGTTTATVSGLPARDNPYTVTVKDAKNCSKTIHPRIIYPLSTTINEHTVISCYGEADGALQATTVGGVGTNYTYQWYNVTSGTSSAITGATNDICTSLPKGTYRVKVTDIENNSFTSTDFILNQPDSLTITKTVTLPSTLTSSDGEIFLNVSGGTPGYTYAWDHNSHTGNPITGLPAGSTRYKVKVTDTRGCHKTVYPRVVHPLQVTVSITDSISCFGQADGKLLASATGGIGTNYSYQWYKIENGVQNALSSGNILSNVGAGKYLVQVTDQENVSAFSTQVEFNAPDTLHITETITLPSSHNASDASILLSVTGGTPAYTYLWEYNNATTNPLTELPASDTPYKVTVTDSRGCTKDAYPRIIYPLEASIHIIDSISCYGKQDGKFLVKAVGGVGNSYTYQWFKIENAVEIPLGADSILTAVSSGTYKAKVTDIEGNEFITPGFVFNSPELLTVTVSKQDLKCKFDTDGEISLTTTGGTLPYSFDWSNSRTTATIGSLAEGAYTYTVTDKRGCSYTDTVRITAPDELQLQIAHIPPRGFNYTDAKVWVTATGGTTPYSYTWQGRSETIDSLQQVGHGTYTAIVTDANGCRKEITVNVPNPPLLEVFVDETRVISCNGRSDGQLTATSKGGVGSHAYTWYRINGNDRITLGSGNILNNIPAGNYIVKVTDDNGVEAYTQEFTLVQPDELTAVINAGSIACNGDTDGWAEATVSGGTLPYVYQWTSGHTTSRVEGLTDDRYLVFVRDTRGCETKAVAEITVPFGLIIDTIVNHPLCNGDSNGSILFTVSGGVAPYTCRWEDGSNAALRTNLPAGKYSLTVTGANGCFKKLDFNLKNPENQTIDLGADKTLCLGQSTELNATIPDAGATYKWFRNNQPFASTAVINVAQEGTYRVEVVNSNGCTAQGFVNVHSSNQQISASFAVATKVARGTTTRLVNENYPSPEYIEWILPDESDVAVVQTTQEFAEVIFLYEGTYTVGMRSVQGECEQVIYKSVEVVGEYEVIDPETPKGTYLRQFIVYPNPSSGVFTAKVEFSEKTDIRLRLVSVTGATVSDHSFENDNVFLVPYNLPNLQGVYILQLISPKANTSVKLIIAP